MTLITDPTQPLFKDGLWGWDGNTWRKAPIPWGYRAAYWDRLDADDVGAGNYNIDLSTVPAGEIWVLTSLAAYALQANPTHIFLSVVHGGTLYYLKRVAYATALLTVDVQCHVVLEPGDKARATFAACAAGDDLRAFAAGYKMKIDE